jgi:hypothetical protein
MKSKRLHVRVVLGMTLNSETCLTSGENLLNTVQGSWLATADKAGLHMTHTGSTTITCTVTLNHLLS